jgi:hypothetical protein
MLSRRVGSIASAEIAIPGKLDTGYGTAFAHLGVVVEKSSKSVNGLFRGVNKFI